MHFSPFLKSPGARENFSRFFDVYIEGHPAGGKSRRGQGNAGRRLPERKVIKETGDDQ
jgi:hypothetical protein